MCCLPLPSVACSITGLCCQDVLQVFEDGALFFPPCPEGLWPARTDLGTPGNTCFRELVLLGKDCHGHPPTSTPSACSLLPPHNQPSLLPWLASRYFHPSPVQAKRKVLHWCVVGAPCQGGVWALAVAGRERSALPPLQTCHRLSSSAETPTHNTVTAVRDQDVVTFCVGGSLCILFLITIFWYFFLIYTEVKED